MPEAAGYDRGLLAALGEEQFRIVGVDSTEPEKTKFGLVALVVPKEEDGK